MGSERKDEEIYAGRGRKDSDAGQGNTRFEIGKVGSGKNVIATIEKEDSEKARMKADEATHLETVRAEDSAQATAATAAKDNAWVTTKKNVGDAAEDGGEKTTETTERISNDDQGNAWNSKIKVGLGSSDAEGTISLGQLQEWFTELRLEEKNREIEMGDIRKKVESVAVENERLREAIKEIGERTESTELGEGELRAQIREIKKELQSDLLKIKISADETNFDLYKLKCDLGIIQQMESDTSSEGGRS